MPSESATFLISQFPASYKPTIARITELLGLNDVNTTLASLVNVVNQPEAAALRNEIMAMHGGKIVMVKLWTLLRVPGGELWETGGGKQPAGFAVPDAVRDAPKPEPRGDPFEFRDDAFEVDYGQMNGEPFGALDGDFDRANSKSRSLSRSPPSRSRSPSLAPSPPKKKYTAKRSLPLKRKSESPHVSEDEEEPAPKRARASNSRTSAPPAPSKPKQPSPEPPSNSKGKQKETEAAPVKEKSATPAGKRGKEKLDEVIIALANRDALDEGVDVERTPGGLGRCPHHLKLKSFPSQLIISLPFRPLRLEITPSRTTSLRLTVDGMSSKKGVNLKGSAWGILHAAVVLIRREAPLSSEHWTKFEFKKLFPDYKKEGLINPYANKVLVQPSPVNPDEILRKETVEWLQDIAESDDPCAFVEYEGKCEFCEAVRKWSDEGERKLEAWKRWTAGKDEVE